LILDQVLVVVKLHRQLPSLGWYSELDFDPEVYYTEIFNWIYDHNFDFYLDFF